MPHRRLPVQCCLDESTTRRFKRAKEHCETEDIHYTDNSYALSLLIAGIEEIEKDIVRTRKERLEHLGVTLPVGAFQASTDDHAIHCLERLIFDLTGGK